MAELDLKLLRQLRTPISSPDRKPITTPEAVTGVKRIRISSLNMELVKKLRTPIQSPDMAEAESSRGIKRISTLDENITETADKDNETLNGLISHHPESNRIHTRSLSEGSMQKIHPSDGVPNRKEDPEADRATKAEGGEEQPRYMRQQGETLKDYLHRTKTDVFLFLREALKPTYLTPAQEMKIVEELREAYQVMWQGQRVPRKGRYLIKSECERVLSVLDGAILRS